MSLANFPILFDETEILRPRKWQRTFSVVETVNTTEGGTDRVEITRKDKLSISAQFGVTGAWAKIFKAFSKQDSIEVTMYDTETETYETRTMRIRNYKEDLKKGSELLTAVNGVWSISFTLKEF